jgi:hypothetical protein
LKHALPPDQVSQRPFFIRLVVVPAHVIPFAAHRSILLSVMPSSLHLRIPDVGIHGIDLRHLFDFEKMVLLELSKLPLLFGRQLHARKEVLSVMALDCSALHVYMEVCLVVFVAPDAHAEVIFFLGRYGDRILQVFLDDIFKDEFDLLFC